MTEAVPPLARRSNSRPAPRWWRKAQVAARRNNLYWWLEVLAAAVLISMLVASYLAIAGRSESQQIVPSAQAAAMLVGTLIPALLLIVLWGRRLAIRRAGATTARLHVNLVFFFSLMAAIPTLFVAVFASILFQSGVQFWFSDQSRGLMENANELARGYYDENQRQVGDETITMAGDLRYVLQQTDMTNPEFEQAYALQVYYRKLDESAILLRASDGALRIVAIVDPGEDIERERVSPDIERRLAAGETAVVNATNERIEAVTMLDAEMGLFLYAARNSDAAALTQYRRSEAVVEGYAELTQRAHSLQLQFNLTLFGVSLALVGLAVFVALRFADRQVKPLAELADAAKEIAEGNYAKRVSGRTGPDEIGLLNRAFNRMSEQIERQTDALIGANRQLGERRAFIEAVLQSITAGIVTTDPQGQILLMNSSAQQLLLGAPGPVPAERELGELAPEIAALLESGADHGLVQYRKDGELLTLAVKLAPLTQGHVVTFEDITRQLLDQRQAAWSDVARRIAHEIKNPLTPIQLATERLKRRYTKQLTSDQALFEELTGTIIRQVGDLRKMVDEFSSFARLPKPVFRQEDALDLIKQAMFLQEIGHPQINYRLDAADGLPAIHCDRHQVGQAMTNLLKNAAEAIDTRQRDAATPDDYRGEVQVRVTADDTHLSVTVRDNGIGLPASGERLMEPYVTTREKGTGLGPAIVKKIVEEHGGELLFAGAEDEAGGAVATLRFARDPTARPGQSEAAE